MGLRVWALLLAVTWADKLDATEDEAPVVVRWRSAEAPDGLLGSAMGLMNRLISRQRVNRWKQASADAFLGVQDAAFNLRNRFAPSELSDEDPVVVSLSLPEVERVRTSPEPEDSLFGRFKSRVRSSFVEDDDAAFPDPMIFGEMLDSLFADFDAPVWRPRHHCCSKFFGSFPIHSFIIKLNDDGTIQSSEEIPVFQGLAEKPFPAALEPPAVQQPSKDVKLAPTSCNADAAKLCPSSVPRQSLDLLHCLHIHQTDLSTKCKSEVLNSPAFHCASDLKTRCPAVVTSTEVKECLAKNQSVAPLSTMCVSAIFRSAKSDTTSFVEKPVAATTTETTHPVDLLPLFIVLGILAFFLVTCPLFLCWVRRTPRKQTSFVQLPSPNPGQVSEIHAPELANNNVPVAVL